MTAYAGCPVNHPYRGRSNVSAIVWDALEEAERLAGFKFVITQGECSTGVEASAGTHDGRGTIDLRARTHNAHQRAIVVRSLRLVGFAVWLRLKSQGFAVDHYHAILKGVPGTAPAAVRQIKAFEAKRTGLRSNRSDPTISDAYVGMTWGKYLAAKKAASTVRGATPAPPGVDRTIDAGAINYAAQGKPMDGRWGHDAEQFMAVASPNGYAAIPWTTFWAWHKAQPGPRKAELFQFAIRSLQAKSRHLQTGRYDAKLARVFAAAGYTSTGLTG